MRSGTRSVLLITGIENADRPSARLRRLRLIQHEVDTGRALDRNVTRRRRVCVGAVRIAGSVVVAFASCAAV
jgi:hypothetical protein